MIAGLQTVELAAIFSVYKDFCGYKVAKNGVSFNEGNMQ